MKGPVASFLFDVHYSVPETTYQWHIQLDCGCVRDVLPATTLTTTPPPIHTDHCDDRFIVNPSSLRYRRAT
jgi:hypothetical protein